MNLVDPRRLKKILLAKEVGQFLERGHKAEEREAVEGVARMLADDVSHHVRSTLAFSLRQSRHLSLDIAEKIARDSEDIASPFLAETPAFSDEHFARLVPSLQEFARIVIARRTDVGRMTAVSIASSGNETSVTYLLRNKNVAFTQGSAVTVAKRFVKNQPLLDELSRRDDLPLAVVRDIIDRVSEQCRTELIVRYKIAPKVAELVTGQSSSNAMWDWLQKASRPQIHAYAVELRRDGRLDFHAVLDMAEKGSLVFLESALAVAAGVTVAEVREALTLVSKESFLSVVKQADLPAASAPRILELAKSHYAAE